MKQNFFKVALFAFCLGTAFSCTKEIAENVSVQRQTVTFHAYDAEVNELTKTTLSGTSVLWNPGDEIMVYQGTKSSGKFTATATEVCASTDFTGTLPYIIGSQEASAEASNIWAVYPYSAACGCDGSSVTIKVDAEQTAQEGTFASGLFPSVAKSNAYSLAFYNVCGGVKFTVAQEGIKKVIFRGNASENLAGKVKVSFFEGLPLVSSITEAVDSIIVNAPSSDGFTPGKEYFIVTIPSALNYGYKVTFVGQYDRVNYSSKISAEIKRKTFGVLQEKDKVGIFFRDAEAKVACVAKFDTNDDGEMSIEEAKVPTTLNGLFEGHESVEYFPELQYFTSVTDLAGCFTDCAQLKEINIPSFITAIGEEAFLGCSALGQIYIPSTVTSIGENAFQDCTSLLSITINEGVKTLGARSFSNIGAFSITLPASITKIGKRAFGNGINKIIMKGTTPPEIADPSFATSTIIYVPDEALSSYRGSENWSEITDQILPISEQNKDLSKNGTANCYIVSSAGTYKFNASVKGNSTESVGTPVSAEVLWESFGTDVAPSVGDIIASASLGGGYVTFSTPKTLANGNAVIAVKDANGTILWSWHIWVCNGWNPTATKQVYKNNAGTMMDRNLGATSATPGDVHALGLLYQWGRKDPFLSGGGISSSPSAQWVSKNILKFPDSTGPTSIEYSVEHPCTFITVNYNTYDWISGNYVENTRWESVKTIYDPCPSGWRVPDGGSSGIWKLAGMSSSTCVRDNNKNGYYCDHTISDSYVWYPAAGERQSHNSGNYDEKSTRGCYWSCSMSGIWAYLLTLEPSQVDAMQSGGQYRACGRSVRCCKE